MPINFYNLTLAGPSNSSGSTAVTNITSSATSNTLDPQIYGSGIDSLVWTGTVDVNTPSAAVSASGSQVTSSSGLLFTTSTAHGFALGLKVQFTTDTTLPTGISALTDYFVVPITATTYKVATSLANALAGTVVAYTNTGTGDQTATPVAIADATIILQGSSDNFTTYSTIPNSTQTITADGSWRFELDYIRDSAYRVYVSLSAGQLQVTKNQIAYKVGD